MQEKNEQPFIPLDDILDELEKTVAKMEMQMDMDPVEFLGLMDEVYDRFKQAQRKGYATKTAMPQFEYIQKYLIKNAVLFLRQIGGSEGLKKARESQQPEPEKWWWYMDEIVSSERKYHIKRFVTYGVVAVVVLAVLVIVYNTFFAPSAETKAMLGHEGMSENYVMEGEFDKALVEIDSALAYGPEDPGLLIKRGILQEILGNEEESAKDLDRAALIFDNQETYLITLAQEYARASLFDMVIETTEYLLEINPQSAEAHLLMAQGFEGQGDLRTAVMLYEECVRLAEEQDRADLTVLAKMQLGYLLQSINPTEQSQ